MTTPATSSGSRIAAAILAAGVLIAGAIVWTGVRIERRLAAPANVSPPAAAPAAGGRAPGGAPGGAPAATAAGQPVPAAALPPVDPYRGVVAHDTFQKAWSPTFAREAEARCWRPLATTKPHLPNAPIFVIEVDAAGQVTAVEPRPMEPEPVRPLYDCLAGIIKTMRFEPSGRHQTARVQASRPPAP